MVEFLFGESHIAVLQHDCNEGQQLAQRFQHRDLINFTVFMGVTTVSAPDIVSTQKRESLLFSTPSNFFFSMLRAFHHFSLLKMQDLYL
mmetsp:Transcript_19042/g.27539  ORF Transcript_19042/g.27539 Transcript_19042/m.27539 type:complete len:89 (-) Transcript_19042:143-409(-)